MKLHNRHSTRLSSWDYSSNGYYFVTICAHKRESIFGEIKNNKMHENEIGKIVNGIWKDLISTKIESDVFQVMPNHFHGIISINNKYVGARFIAPKMNNKTKTLGEIVRHFKAKCSYNLHKIGFNQIIWQRNYYEHIIRNENELNKIRNYIINNPKNWLNDINYLK